jgi:Cu+-exporting ATPase
MSESLRIPGDGMTCMACVSRITRSVRKVGGVEWVRVGLEPDEAVVRFDPQRTTLGAIAEAIVVAGYEPRTDGASACVSSGRRGLLWRLGLRD